MAEGIGVSIKGDDIYEQVRLPFVPRKGDILWLSSLTRGASEIPQVLVSRVEWSMDQTTGVLHVWLIVRRISSKKEGG